MAPENDQQGETPGTNPPPGTPGEQGQQPPVRTAADIYKDFEAELFKREVSNAEAYDKSVMMYATGALALSLTFIKDLLPPGKAVYMCALYGAWVAFLASLIAVLLSYMAGQLAIRKQRVLAYEYYVDGNEDSLKPEKNPWVARTDRLNIGSGAFFIVGAALMTWFVAWNVAVRETPAGLANDAAHPSSGPQSSIVVANNAPLLVVQTSAMAAPLPVTVKCPVQPPHRPPVKPGTTKLKTFQPQGADHSCPAKS
jgi:hypothetical protein